jgi:hypothetical protein
MEKTEKREGVEVYLEEGYTTIRIKNHETPFKTSGGKTKCIAETHGMYPALYTDGDPAGINVLVNSMVFVPYTPGVGKEPIDRPEKGSKPAPVKATTPKLRFSL